MRPVRRRPKRRGILSRSRGVPRAARRHRLCRRADTDGQEDARCTVRATGGPGGAEGAASSGRAPRTRTTTSSSRNRPPTPRPSPPSASRRGLPERAVTIALATAMQESKLRNIGHGDRDSLGLFQQRPSQGWGTARQIQDPVYSAAKFYDHLVQDPRLLAAAADRRRAARAAQRLPAGVRQARDERHTARLRPDRPPAAALNCTTGAGDDRGPGDPAQVRERLVREFGRDVLPRRRRRCRLGAGRRPRAAASAARPRAVGHGRARPASAGDRR